ncbi:MAG TPA: T9SS type A sorting domain-containing protein [Rubricoccaceae bacterium]|jgi:hypothetical protein
MNRLVFLSVFVVLAPRVRAQISITRADVEPVYTTTTTSTSFTTDTSTTTRAVLQGLAGQAGGGQTWTFTGLPFTAAGTITSTPVPAPQPGSDDPHFAQANRIVRADSAGTTDRPAYSYVRLTDNGVTLYGSAVNGEDGVTKVKFVPGTVQPLPYTFGSSWTTESQLVIDPTPFPIEQTTREESEVVGWGTLVTPGGTAPALMVRTLFVNRSRIVIPGLPPIESADSTRGVAFVTKGQIGAFIALDVDGQALDGSYSAQGNGTASGPDPDAGTGLVLAVGPNPATRGPVSVRFVLPESGPVTTVVYDALGRSVAVLADGVLSAGEHALTWDSTGAPIGLYVVRVQSGAASSSRRVVVAQ